tara:strand:- start:160 stop:357 length:198 start_codon:yes stop_codon:yes gene_type:complete
MKENKRLINEYTKTLTKEELQELSYYLLTDEIERILLAVELTGNKIKASRLIGIPQRTIYRRLKH